MSINPIKEFVIQFFFQTIPGPYVGGGGSGGLDELHTNAPGPDEFTLARFYSQPARQQPATANQPATEGKYSSTKPPKEPHPLLKILHMGLYSNLHLPMFTETVCRKDILYCIAIITSFQ